MIVVVIIGLLAAVGVPAYQKIRNTSQEKAITSNLRQLASGADQYFLEKGLNTVTTDELVGTGTNAYVKSFGSVAKETYQSPISATDTALTADSSVITVTILF